MINSIVVRLPYPHKFLGLTISKGRDIGFLFTNLSMFLFRENCKLETSTHYERWIKEHGQARLVTEMMYASAQAYYLTERRKEPFEKIKLLQAVSMADEATQKQIVEAMEKSQTFGLVESKKKVRMKR